MEIDNLDKKIINELSADSKQSYRDIAKRVRASAVTVMKRLHRLEREKVIRGYSIDIDYEKIGFEISVIVDVRVSKGKLIQVEKKIAAHKNVFAVYDNTGQFDVTVLARFRTRAGMDNFLKRLQSFDFVQRTETKLILGTIKEGNLEV